MYGMLYITIFVFSTKVMNFYLSLIMERSSGEAGRLKVYSFSTFFFPKLRGGGGGQAGGHAAVKRWTKAVDLFTFDLILVPLHLGVHWALAVSHFGSTSFWLALPKNTCNIAKAHSVHLNCDQYFCQSLSQIKCLHCFYSREAEVHILIAHLFLCRW